jgi:hypothetical protein
MIWERRHGTKEEMKRVSHRQIQPPSFAAGDEEGRRRRTAT